MSSPQQRASLVVGNWKMHKTVAEARLLIDALRESEAKFPADVEVVVAPPFTALGAVGARLHLGQAGHIRSRIALAAQNMHDELQGAFTGEISATMLLELHVRWVIIGHSERRLYFGESDASVARKVRTALLRGIIPIVAVGETLDEHEAGIASERVRSQVQIAFEDLAADDVRRCVVAYEPIWAIGTGQSDDPASANRVMGRIRTAVDGLDDARLLYGGSVKPDNMAAFAAQPNIDGALVGGASLRADTFTAIVLNARKVVHRR
jgi:triosephosphate isomerase (TIM)